MGGVLEWSVPALFMDLRSNMKKTYTTAIDSTATVDAFLTKLVSDVGRYGERAQDENAGTQAIIFNSFRNSGEKVKKQKRKSGARSHFFDKQVHMKEWKESMSGENEKIVVEMLDSWGYEKGQDYVRQLPVGDKYVCDFAFPKERVVLEVDGNDHKSKERRLKDEKRDRFFYRNGWAVIRMTDEQLTKAPSFFRHLIKEVIDERKKGVKKIYDDFIY